MSERENLSESIRGKMVKKESEKEANERKREKERCWIWSTKARRLQTV